MASRLWALEFLDIVEDEEKWVGAQLAWVGHSTLKV